MDFYIDIRLLPDPEFASHLLLDAVFARLHRTLVQRQCCEIGLSFPAASNQHSSLGSHLRLHGSDHALARLMDERWLTGMRDHTQVGQVTQVPAAAAEQVVRRVQAKSNPERLRRRQMKRKGWTPEQARAAIPESVAETLKLPFITVRSQSTGQAFRLFIDQHAVAHSATGSFNAYGLSSSATLPMF